MTLILVRIDSGYKTKKVIVYRAILQKKGYMKKTDADGNGKSLTTLKKRFLVIDIEINKNARE